MTCTSKTHAEPVEPLFYENVQVKHLDRAIAIYIPSNLRDALMGEHACKGSSTVSAEIQTHGVRFVCGVRQGIPSVNAGARLAVQDPEVMFPRLAAPLTLQMVVGHLRTHKKRIHVHIALPPDHLTVTHRIDGCSPPEHV